MNTTQLKRFAQEARRKLLEQVAAKLDFVKSSDTSELRGKTDTLNKLKREIRKHGEEAVIDKVAYTWFNRLVALRFMDANEYQPIGMSVVSPRTAEHVSPEILNEAHRGNISPELKVDRTEVMSILNGIKPTNNPDNEVYRILLVAACNHLSKLFPFLFERIDDYTELLLPDDLTSPFSIVTDIYKGMSDEDCKEVEIIGWLYQFYISERKDEVFASKKAVQKEDIPAATQLFTPRWIVEYMVQNTVGKLWLQNRPNSKIKEVMPYYLESPSAKSDDYLKLDSVEEIKLLDPACGSGHILVYGFELLYYIYEEEGYRPDEIPELIIKNNLYGLEIDERASQLAEMALMMKARSKNHGFFKKGVKPNIITFTDFEYDAEEVNKIFKDSNIQIPKTLHSDLELMTQATNYGSLIQPETELSELTSIRTQLEKAHNTNNVFIQSKIDELTLAIDQLIALSQKFHCVVANPPYMGSGNMNKELSNFVKSKYPDSKADLFSSFIERALYFVPINGYNGLVTMESWMFLSSFEKFRKRLIENVRIHSLTHFGWHIMRIAFGTVTFILEKSKPENDFKGVYSYMEIDNINPETERPYEFPKQNERYKIADQKNFEKIPGSPIGYWLPHSFIDKIGSNKSIESYGKATKGLDTCDNDKFVRYWNEVDGEKFSKYKDCNSKWYVYQKGGDFRRWFGNNEKVVNWQNDGFEIKNFKDENGKVRSRPQNLIRYFTKGITWSAIGSSKTSYRLLENSIFGGGGNGLFLEDSYFNYLLGLLNSKITNLFLKLFNPTLNNLTGDLHKIPVLFKKEYTLQISEIVDNTIKISKSDWNSHEVSWDFKQNELIRLKSGTLEESFNNYKNFWKEQFFQLHENEEELNRQFIEIYGLQDELTPDVPLEEITILQEETGIENGELVFYADKVMEQFVSYAVGCMFGRYSLDKEGLILANQGEDLKDYLDKIEKSEEEVAFLPVEDNIIPVLDEEWFADDIVERFNSFLKVSFGERNFRENLNFVEESLGKDIRKYFTRDFYNDHIKRYKKRPIYWMFSSPKGYFNVLIYMHRYTPDTVSRILNSYLREFIDKLERQRKQQEHIEVSGSTVEQNRARKEIDRIDIMLNDCKEYEKEILYPLATERVEIDLDDGVLVNYNKMGSAVAKVAGLNDKDAKKKVRKFDWIDTSLIRD
jgi:hypothetical protein